MKCLHRLSDTKGAEISVCTALSVKLTTETPQLLFVIIYWAVNIETLHYTLVRAHLVVRARMFCLHSLGFWSIL
jgi:hypothetical protein